MALPEAPRGTEFMVCDSSPKAPVYEVRSSLDAASFVCPPSSDLLSFVRSLVRRAGWDGDRAHSIPRKAADQAIEFLTTLRVERLDVPDPAVAPSVYGAISFYWNHGDQHLTVRFYGRKDKGIQCRYKQTGQPGDEVPCSILEAIRTLKAIYESHAAPS